MSNRDFEAELGPFTDVTVQDLQEAMKLIPAEIVEALSRGPHYDRYACNVCRAFGAEWYKTATWDRSDPMCVIFCYHEVPKIRMRIAEDQWSGEAAEDVFRRCLDIYRAAGWDGESSFYATETW